MPRIALIPAYRASRELRLAYRRVGELWHASGRPPLAMQIVQCFAHRPRFVQHFAEGYHYVGWGGKLPRAVRELTAVLVSRENDCFY
jgi:alkylhydroperoxidase family enzyme